MKRALYISLFTLLGIMVSFLVHGALEIPALAWLTSDLSRYETSWLWQHWQVVHNTVSWILLLSGAVVGFWQGVYWWNMLYVRKGVA